MKNIVVSLLASLLVVACSGSPAAKIESVTKTPTQMVDASTVVDVPDTGATPSEDTGTSSGSDTGTVASSGTGSSSGSGSGSSSSGSGSGSSKPVEDAGHDTGMKAEDAGHDSAPPTPCTLPVTAVTYTYVFTNVTVNCDNTLASYPVGPLNPGAFDLETLVPGFCATAAGVSTVTGLTESADGCMVSATTTCSDPVPATLPDGGVDPLTDVSVVKLTSNTGGTVLDGTLSLTTTDEVTKATCTQTYTFVATAK